MTLYELISKIKSTNPYFAKDLEKAKKANKFIGRGSLASSTHKYMQAAGKLANTGSYVKEDVVFVSAEGMRPFREEVDFEELQKAVDTGVTFVTDNLYDRNRPYNIGERQVAAFLKKNGYFDNDSGIWKKI
jgi:hypothetical protein